MRLIKLFSIWYVALTLIREPSIALFFKSTGLLISCCVFNYHNLKDVENKEGPIPKRGQCPFFNTFYVACLTNILIWIPHGMNNIGVVIWLNASSAPLDATYIIVHCFIALFEMHMRAHYIIAHVLHRNRGMPLICKINSKTNKRVYWQSPVVLTWKQTK